RRLYCALRSRGPLSGRFPGIRRDIQTPNNFGSHGMRANLVVPRRAAGSLASVPADADGASPALGLGLVDLDPCDVARFDRLGRWPAAPRNPFDTDLAMPDDPA